ncbi:MAG: NfeD family protein, partial [Burkholderiales bacterium]
MSVFASYLVAQLPGWLLAFIAVWALQRAGALPSWGSAILLAMWVVKDLLMYSVMRRFYQPQSPSARMVGEAGTAVTDLSPTGFVRVSGELWQARADGPVTG